MCIIYKVKLHTLRLSMLYLLRWSECTFCNDDIYFRLLRKAVCEELGGFHSRFRCSIALMRQNSNSVTM